MHHLITLLCARIKLRILNKVIRFSIVANDFSTKVEKKKTSLSLDARNISQCTYNPFLLFNCIALFVLSALQLNAQNDSLKNNRFRFFLSGYITHGQIVSPADTDDLDGFQLTNPFFVDYNNATGYLGNLGSALRTDYSALNDDLNFHYRTDYYSTYHYNDRPAGFDGMRNIHSKMEYYRGAKKEQLFQFDHSQRLSKNFAFGLDYQNIISPSFYKRATTTDRAFDFYILFETTNNRYSAFADYVSNRTDNNINGGLESELSLDTTKQNIDVKTLPVNLDDAQWLTKQKSYIFKQQFNFKTASHISEANAADTTLKAAEVNVPLIFIHHDFSYTTYGELFTSSNDSALWPVNYYDSVTTFDTASSEQFLNSVYFQSDLLGEKIQLKAGANNQYMNFKDRLVDSVINRTSVYGSAAVDINEQLKAGIYYEQNVAGDANSAYMLKCAASYAFKNINLGKLSLQLLNSKQPVYIMANIYHTNHFNHSNDFTLISRSVFMADYTHPFFSAGYNITNLQNFVLYDRVANPLQHKSSLVYSSAYLKFIVRLKRFNLMNDAKVNFNDADKIIHLPLLSLHSAIYYDNYLFKKALHGQTGFDVFYNTAYYADAFMPGLQEFYLQDTAKTGNYFFIDFYASVRIRTAKIFIKVENIGSGLFGNNYFITPKYPLQGRGLRLGLQWSFFN